MLISIVGDTNRISSSLAITRLVFDRFHFEKPIYGEVYDFPYVGIARVITALINHILSSPKMQCTIIIKNVREIYSIFSIKTFIRVEALTF